MQNSSKTWTIQRMIVEKGVKSRRCHPSHSTTLAKRLGWQKWTCNKWFYVHNKTWILNASKHAWKAQINRQFVWSTNGILFYDAFQHANTFVANGMAEGSKMENLSIIIQNCIANTWTAFISRHWLQDRLQLCPILAICQLLKIYTTKEDIPIGCWSHTSSRCFCGIRSGINSALWKNKEGQQICCLDIWDKSLDLHSLSWK